MSQTNKMFKISGTVLGVPITICIGDGTEPEDGNVYAIVNAIQELILSKSNEVSEWFAPNIQKKINQIFTYPQQPKKSNGRFKINGIEMTNINIVEEITDKTISITRKEEKTNPCIVWSC